jgi:hypothetical protein
VAKADRDQVCHRSRCARGTLELPDVLELLVLVLELTG